MRLIKETEGRFNLPSKNKKKCGKVVGWRPIIVARSPAVGKGAAKTTTNGGRGKKERRPTPGGSRRDYGKEKGEASLTKTTRMEPLGLG